MRLSVYSLVEEAVDFNCMWIIITYLMLITQIGKAIATESELVYLEWNRKGRGGKEREICLPYVIDHEFEGENHKSHISNGLIFWTFEAIALLECKSQLKEYKNQKKSKTPD